MRVMDPDLAESFGLKDANGVLVNRVIPDSPAAEAGMQHGDVILAFNDQPIETSPQVQNLVAYTPPGTKVELRVWRQGLDDQPDREVAVSVTLKQQPEGFSTRQTFTASRPPAEAESDQKPARGFSWREGGMRLDPITKPLAEQYDLGDRQTGLVVTAVNSDGPAERAGISEGDVILEINGRTLGDLDDLEAALDKVSLHRGIRLYVDTRFGPLYLLMRDDR
jgi:serine protease Do